MESIIWEGDAGNDPPELRSPIVIATFSGWNDAATSATMALDAIAASLDSDAVARLDAEPFYDFQANRPTIRITSGELQGIIWPTNRVVTARAAAASRDAILIHGTEPSTHWRTYCEALLDIVERLDAQMLITLGALIADVSHTRPVPITGLASDAAAISNLGLDDVNFEGPTGITGVMHETAKRRGLASASLWAAIPHYAAAVPNPKAALALVRRVEGLTGIAIEAAGLERSGERFVAQLDRAIAANPEIKELVAKLERQQDETVDIAAELPTGDAIASEIQRFLRRHDGDSAD